MKNFTACARLGLTLRHLEVRPNPYAAHVELVCSIPTVATLAQVLAHLQALPVVQAAQANMDDRP